jgi:UMP-CMP kinase
MFDIELTKIYFVLGGPGAGKGTQCTMLANEFGLSHFSVGDLLRTERDSGSKQATLINHYIENGLIVPQKITIGLLKDAIESTSNINGYLIDGFPRAIDQMVEFEKSVVPAKFCMYFSCNDEELKCRLLKRGQTSGRVDDNIEVIKKRLCTFYTTSMPVITSLDIDNRLIEIDSCRPINEVYAHTRTKFLPNKK